MKIQDVIKLSPFQRLVYWIKERENIRRTRENGLVFPPWTDDEILQRYRFCNVRRMDDKVSRWLLNNWYEPFKDHPNMLRAVALARFFNLPSLLGEITYLVLLDRPWNNRHLVNRITKLRKQGHKTFNAAYMVRGNDGPDKIHSVIYHNVAELFKAKVEVDPSSMEETWRRIEGVYGFGGFMAGQVVADLRWAITGEWKDRQLWAPMGPGSRRGMNRLLGRDLKQPLDQATFLSELNVIRDRLWNSLPERITGRLEMMDYQNCLCEFDKYSRALLGEGRPKQNYKGY